MNARTRIIIYLLPITFMFVSGFFYSFDTSSEEIPVPVATYSVASEPVPERVIHATVDGKSMEPFLKDGDPLSIYPDDVPKEGDIISFKCLVKKCKYHDDYFYAKFLKKIDEKGCIYVRGRTDYFYLNGVESESFDSHIYGKLCPGEFEIEGVIR